MKERTNGRQQDRPHFEGLQDGLNDTMEDIADLYDFVILTDPGGAAALDSHGATRLARGMVVQVEPTGTVAPAVLHLMRNGRPAVTWCSATPTGNEIARKVHNSLQRAGDLRHITAIDPAAWTGSPPIENLIDTASPKRPAPIKGAGAGAKGGQVAASAGAAAGDTFGTSPGDLARRIILRYGAELLIVDDGLYGSGRALDTSTGIWTASGRPWTRWFTEIANTMRAEALRSGLTDRALSTTLLQISRVKKPSVINDTHSMLTGTLDHERENGEPCRDVTECKAEELDDSKRYIGTASGVVDLRRGKLLPPDEGRTHLVTLKTEVTFDPDATSPDVDRLFAHLPDEDQRWWWEVLGYALHGSPTLRCYLVKGLPGGGKSTVSKALQLTLGPYASAPPASILQDRRGDEPDASPGLRYIVSPARVALIDEVKTHTINNRSMKAWASGDPVTFRGLYADFVTKDVTATMVLLCNPGSEPDMRLHDEGMQVRYRELPYPPLPEGDRDPQFVDSVIHSPAFKRALLARLVAEAAKATPGEPPKDSPSVKKATAEAIRADGGDFGTFARRIVPGPGVLTFAAVWQAWLEHCGEEPEAVTAGGIAKRTMSRALVARVAELKPPTTVRMGGLPVRAWRGWRLQPAEEAEPREHATAVKEAAPPYTVGTEEGGPLHPPAWWQFARLVETVSEPRLPLMMRLLSKLHGDPSVVAYVGEDTLPLFPAPAYEQTDDDVKRRRNGDTVTKEPGKWDSDGSPARVEVPPEWSRTPAGRLLWLCQQYPDVAGAVDTAQFRGSLAKLVDEAALLLPENERADWTAAAKADKHVARHLQSGPEPEPEA